LKPVNKDSWDIGSATCMELGRCDSPTDCSAPDGVIIETAITASDVLVSCGGQYLI
jgi:hypothetical protein